MRFWFVLLFSLACCFAALAAPQVATESSTAGIAPFPVSAADLINLGSPHRGNSVVSRSSSSFSPLGITDGAASDTNDHNAFFDARRSDHFPATALYELNLASAPGGFDLTSVASFMGWDTNNQAQANQTYTLEVRHVATGVFTQLVEVDFEPFAPVNGPHHETKVTITDDGGGLLASGIDALRFTFAEPQIGSGAFPGTVVREIDVFGNPTPLPLAVTAPQRRHVQQRQGGLADIAIVGTVDDDPDQIEARAVVRGGAEDNGTATAWQVIDTSVIGGAFSGALVDVAEGGWYDIEVRSIKAGLEVHSFTVERVGVGDIYVTAGQSNAANFGSPSQATSSDRISARTSVNQATWAKADDPLPIADGSGASPWSRLGDLLEQHEDVPIGFVALGREGSRINEWQPGQVFYHTLLLPVLQSLGVDGFVAVLWHQGEQDARNNTGFAAYQATLADLIQQARSDAGWGMPWYIAEATYHPSANLSRELPISAAQRAVVFADPLTHLGPNTDPFHTQGGNGGKLHDGAHFNAAGLADHAGQWFKILTVPSTDAAHFELLNGDFEDNFDGSIGGSFMFDGGISAVNRNLNNSFEVLHWRIYGPSGTGIGQTAEGLMNPNDLWYTGARDSNNNGVLPNMDGRIAVYLHDGEAGNHLLQTLRATLVPNHTYTLRASIGVRNNGATFGAVRLDLLGNGQVLGPGAVFTEADLDALAAGSATDKWTVVEYSFSTGDPVVPGQYIGVRITKTTGVGYVDIDNVQLVAEPTVVGAFQIEHFGSTHAPEAAAAADPDVDGLPNVIEHCLGTDPTAVSPKFMPELAVNAVGEQVMRYRIPLDPAVDTSGLDIEYCIDCRLQQWHSARHPDPAHVGLTSTPGSSAWVLDVPLDLADHVAFRLRATP